MYSITYVRTNACAYIYIYIHAYLELHDLVLEPASLVLSSKLELSYLPLLHEVSSTMESLATTRRWAACLHTLRVCTGLKASGSKVLHL